MSALYYTSNAFFMTHQPEFMLGMLVGFSALCIGLALIDSRNVKRNNRKGR